MKVFPWKLIWSYNLEGRLSDEAGPVELEKLNTNFLITGTGVCIVWLVGTLATVTEVLYVGADSKGNLPTLLANLQSNERIKNRAAAWAPCEVYVTWAFAYPHDCSGIRNFLIDELNPEFGSKATTDEPIQVNVPGFLAGSSDTV